MAPRPPAAAAACASAAVNGIEMIRMPRKLSPASKPVCFLSSSRSNFKLFCGLESSHGNGSECVLPCTQRLMPFPLKT